MDGRASKIFVALRKTFVYLRDVPKNEPSRVRFSESQLAVLKEIAAACGVNEIDVTRWAVDALGDYWRHHQNRLLLPLRFTETFRIQRIDPQPMILEVEPLPAQSKSGGEAGSGRTSGTTRRRAVPA